MKASDIVRRTPSSVHCLRIRRGVWGGLMLVGMTTLPCRADVPVESCGPDSETTAEGIGLQAASVLSSVFYLPFKSAMALAGGLAGGIAYGFSLGNLEIAEGVWGPSVYGTYLLTPDHLTGCKPIEFFGTVPPSTTQP